MTGARGRSRRRRRVQPAAVGAALVAVVLAGAAVAAATVGDADDVSSAPAPAPPTRTADLALSPATAPPTGTADPAPSPATAPTAAARPDWAPEDAFLEPAAVAELSGSAWKVDPSVPAAPEPVLDPCGADGVPERAQLGPSAERFLHGEREGGGGLRQEVFRYEDDAAAARALADSVARVARCPSTPVEGGPADQQLRWVVVESTPDRLLPEVLSCAPTCDGQWSSVVVTARSGDGLTVASWALDEEGVPVDRARALLDAAAAQLDRAVRG